MSNGKYTYLSWIRKGLASQISEVDQLGGNLSSPYERASLDFKILVKSEGNQLEEVQKTFPLLAPGDVKLKAISNVDSLIMPRRGVRNFEANYFPYIQFYDEDFPWRFSPAKDNEGKLRPWIQLIVLKEDEFEFTGISRANYNSIKIKKGVPIPKHDEYYLWAHVQIDDSLKAAMSTHGSKSEAIKYLIENKPDSISSRILCPRKLDKDCLYHAFLIPAFERGRLAGLAEDIDTDSIHVQQYALQGTETSGEIVFPTYYSWDFHTARHQGDFEELAKRIKKVEAQSLQSDEKELGQKRFSALDIGDGIKYEGKYLSTEGELQMAGALVVPGSTSQTFLTNNSPKAKSFVKQIAAYINTPDNLEDDPVIAPPIYGQWHANKFSVDTEPNQWMSQWLNEVNLDPGNRIAAGLGAEVFKENQENFMSQAWSQYGDIKAANDKIRIAALSKMRNDKIYNKYIKHATSEKLIETSVQLHATIKYGDLSLKHAVFNSSLPNNSISKSFQQFIRFGGSFAKAKEIKPGTKRNEFTKKLQVGNLKKTSAIYSARDTGIYSKNIENLLTNVSKNSSKINTIKISPNLSGAKLTAERNRVKSALKNLKTEISKNQTAVKKKPTLNINRAGNLIAQTLIPVNTIIQKLNGTIKSSGKLTTSFDPIMAYPKITQPLYSHLIKNHKDLFIPNLDAFDNNSISILNTNQKYIESFLLGFNHEMSRELIWREYPTDSRGSYARFFWDSIAERNDKILNLDDRIKKYSHIQEIHKWKGKLGSHENPDNNSNNNLVIIIRGNLLLKYPNTLIYFQKAKWGSTNRQLPRKLDTSKEEIFPEFNAFIGPDTYILGFNLNTEDVKGEVGSSGNPGHFLVLQEPPGENKFGIDVSKDGDTILSWSDLAWNHLKDDTTYVKADDYQNSKKERGSVTWGKNSNHMAYILNQKPFKLAIHADKLI